MTQWTVQDKLALLRQHEEDGVPWTRLATQSGVAPRTLTRWASKFRTDSTLGGLQRRERADHGRRRIPDELVDAIEALTLRRPEPTAAFIHRRVSDIAHDRGLPAPSYSSVRTFIVGIDPGLRTLAQHGDAAYRDRFELVFRRTASKPNEQWQADHTLLDVAILDKLGTAARPWLTIVLDDYSRAIAGYTLFLGAPTAEQTALALHQAVNRKTNPAWPISGLPDIALQRSRLRLHLRSTGTRLPGDPHPTGSLKDGRPAGPRKDRTVLRHDHYRTPPAPARAYTPRHERRPDYCPDAHPRATRQHRRAIYRHRVQQPSTLGNARGSRPTLGYVRVHPARPCASGRPRLTRADRRRNQEGAARRHPVRVHPVRLDRARRIRRRARHRAI